MHRYSVVLNSQIAIPSISSPSATIMPTSSSAGTCQPNQVTPGSSTRARRGEIVEVAEHEPPHRVDGVGERVDAVEDREPRRAGSRPGTARPR